MIRVGLRPGRGGLGNYGPSDVAGMTGLTIVDWTPTATGFGVVSTKYNDSGSRAYPVDVNGKPIPASDGSPLYWDPSGHLVPVATILAEPYPAPGDAIVQSGPGIAPNLSTPANPAGAGLLANQHPAIPLPAGLIPGFPPSNAPGGVGYFYPPTVDGLPSGAPDPNAVVPGGSSIITAAQLAYTAYTGPGGGFASSELDAEDPNSPNFGKSWQTPSGVMPFDPGAAVSVAFWILQGDTVAAAQSQALRASQLLNTPVVTIADLGPIGPGDPIYAALQNLGALDLATLAPQAATVAPSGVTTPAPPSSTPAASAAAVTGGTMLVATNPGTAPVSPLVVVTSGTGAGDAVTTAPSDTTGAGAAAEVTSGLASIPWWGWAIGAGAAYLAFRPRSR